MAVGTVLTIIGIIASIATSAAQGGKAAATKAGARRQAIAEEEEAKRVEKQQTQVNRQGLRVDNMSQLDKQARKRAGALKESRETPSTRPSFANTTATRPVTRGEPTGEAKPVARTSADVIQGIQGVTKLASEVTGEVSAGVDKKNAQLDADEKARQLAELQEQEFQRLMKKRKRDVNSQGLDFQERSLGLPAKTARQTSTQNQDFASIFRKFNGKAA